MIVTPLPNNTSCYEDHPCIFNLTVSDRNAFVYWTVNGLNSPLLPGNRTATDHDHSHGDHQLIINPVMIGDNVIVAKTPTNRGNGTVESRSNLTVMAAEKAPVIGIVSPMPPCSVKDGCTIVIPFQHEGIKKSELRLSCVHNNKSLAMNTNFNITKNIDSFDLAFKHLRQEKSGEYKFTLTNDKGSDEKTIQLTIIDRPSHPLNLTVKPGSRTHDSLILKWSAPLLTYGSSIRKYVIEVCFCIFFHILF